MFRPRRGSNRWGHLAGRVIFPTAYPNGVEIDQKGHPILSDNGTPILSIDLPDPDTMEPIDESISFTELHPEERAEWKVMKHHAKTIESNMIAYGTLLDDTEWVAISSDDEE